MRLDSPTTPAGAPRFARPPARRPLLHRTRAPAGAVAARPHAAVPPASPRSGTGRWTALRPDGPRPLGGGGCLGLGHHQPPRHRQGCGERRRLGRRGRLSGLDGCGARRPDPGPLWVASPVAVGPPPDRRIAPAPRRGAGPPGRLRLACPRCRHGVPRRGDLPLRRRAGPGLRPVRRYGFLPALGLSARRVPHRPDGRCSLGARQHRGPAVAPTHTGSGA